MTKKVSIEKRTFCFSKLVLILGLFSIMLLMVGNVFAADVAYIYKSKPMINKDVLSVFAEMNLSVDTIPEKNLTKYDLSKYRLLYVGNERFSKTIPINSYPSVVTNYYFGYKWGLTDNDGISKLAATSPLSVFKNEQIIQVYTQAKYNGKSISLPYFYLGDLDKVPAMQKIAGTYTGTQTQFDKGDVISFAPAGTHLINGKNAAGNICFFGIVESKYWTPEARDMFKECVGMVAISCSKDSDCGTDTTGDKYCSLNGVYQNTTHYSCQNPGTAQSQCVSNVMTNLIESCSPNKICSNGMCMTANCSTNSQCGADGFQDNFFCQNNSVFGNYVTYTCNNPGTLDSYCSSQTSIQLKEVCSGLCTNGACIPLNITCYNNSQCGTDGFLNQLFCKDGNVFDKYKTYTCNNPGTPQSSCSNDLSDVLKQTCSFGCTNGICNPNPCIDNDQDTYDTCNPGNPGDDGNPLDCNDNNANVHPGAVEICNGIDDDCDGLIDEGGVCIIPCSNNLQCGVDGYVGNPFCTVNDVFQNFITFNCHNPGQTNSYCTNSTAPQFKQTCPAGQTCSGGLCVPINVICSTDAQCDDSNLYTFDQCNNPGTPSSYCSHTPVNCVTNNDCGMTGYTGAEFCSQNDVFKNFMNSTCINPATPFSYCEISVGPRLIQDCGQGTCSNGTCIIITSCVDNDQDGYDTCNPGQPGDDGNPLDCNDNNANVHPGAVEICNGIDDDCDGLIDEGLGTTTCGLGICQKTVNNCVNGVPQICTPFPPSVEVCNLLDDDCDGLVDENNGNCPGGQQCINGQCVPITCYNDADCNDANAHTQDSCINPGTPSSYCTHTPIVCLNNGECGVDGFINGAFCTVDDVFKNYVTYACNNPGQTNSYCSNITTPNIFEDCGDDYCGSFGANYCKNDDVYHNRTCHDKGCSSGNCFDNANIDEQFVQDCTYGCSNAICNPNPCVDNDQDGYDTCAPGNPGDDGNPLDCNDNNANVHPGAVEICNGIDDDCDGQVDETGCNCYNNIDCGTNGFLNQLFCKDGNVFDKYNTYTCNNPGTPQSSCSNDLSDVLKQTCGQGQTCVDGACVPVTCYNDADCDDTNDYTQDTCNNPGLPSSYCSHTPILCFFNSECGTDGFIGNPFCQGNDVFQNYLTYTCNNPGTIISTCSASASPVLKENCPQGQTCDNGQCVPLNITCYNDADCNDANAHTKDTCNNPGTPSSYCSHTPIVCLYDWECGVNGYIGNPFCQDNSVFQNFITWTCHNPGTTFSSCSSSSSPQLKQTCTQEQTCDNGECINHVCNTGTTDQYTTSSGLRFTPILNTVDNNAINILQISAENLDGYSKTVTLQKYSCRCGGHLGESHLPNPMPARVCLDYWPSNIFQGTYEDAVSGVGWHTSACQLVNETITLDAYETKNVQVSATQYQNQFCGSFQLDFAVVNINGVNSFEGVANSVNDLCNDCPAV